MTEDWSLKGKGSKTWQTDNPTIEWLTYTEQDIETLREKLIEDFIDKFKYECSVCCQTAITDDEIREIINKRFGVE